MTVISAKFTNFIVSLHTIPIQFKLPDHPQKNTNNNGNKGDNTMHEKKKTTTNI